MPTHDEIAEDLAANLRTDKRMVWCNVQLGPSGSPRPDVYAIFKSFAHPAPMSYEVKRSVADFRSDVTSGKWQTYLPYSCGVYFAAEAGLGIGKGDVPAHCGLILRGAGGTWRAAKRPVLNPITIPQDALLKLLIDGVEREGPKLRSKYNDWLAHEAIRKRLGEDVALILRDIERARLEIPYAERRAADLLEAAEKQAKRIRADALADVAPLRAELCEALGLPPEADRYEIRAAVLRQSAAARENPAVSKLRNLTTQIRSLIDINGIEDEQPGEAA